MLENYLISAALLNPFGEFLDGSRKSSWWVVRHGQQKMAIETERVFFTEKFCKDFRKPRVFKRLNFSHLAAARVTPFRPLARSGPNRGSSPGSIWLTQKQPIQNNGIFPSSFATKNNFEEVHFIGEISRKQKCINLVILLSLIQSLFIHEVQKRSSQNFSIEKK